MLHVQLSTIAFQIVNFFILLTALTWFLYRPLLQTMRQREDEIAARLRDAEERARRADAERAQLAEEAVRARADAEALLARAQAEASQTRQRLLDQARQEAARYAEEARQRIEEQERAVRQRLEDTVRKTAVAMAGSLIQRAAGPPFHRALIEQLLTGSLAPEGIQRDLLHRAVSRSNGAMTVEVAYPPSPELTERIRETLARLLGVTDRRVEIVVRVDRSLRAGVRILVEDVVVDLSLNRILTELEHGVTPGQET
ncbi:MAG TPA: F0F1 ATP synthase subunit B [bacterium]|nr:F0F1 ATP synthase subunit B [bacterium]